MRGLSFSQQLSVQGSKAFSPQRQQACVPLEVFHRLCVMTERYLRRANRARTSEADRGGGERGRWRGTGNSVLTITS
jgi:hypothetical protein